jgi:site-specific recombinase XerD
VLSKTWEDIPLIKPPKTTRIPDILSVGQVQQLVCAMRQLSYRVFFFTAYCLGLCLGEGIRLKTGDIDPTNMQVHIRDAKGNKDRLVPLPEKTSRYTHLTTVTRNNARQAVNSPADTFDINRGGVK